jgi:hypothetical protein
MFARKKREVQRTFPLFHDAKVREVRHVGKIGEEIIEVFFKGKTPKQISSKLGHPLPLVTAVIEKVTKQKIKPNASYLPPKKLSQVSKKRNLAGLSGKGQPELYKMINDFKHRAVDVNAIMRRLTTPSNSVYQAIRIAERRRRENERITRSLEPKKTKKEIEKYNKKKKPTRMQNAEMKAIEFVIAYPHLPTKINSFRGVMKTKGFVSVKDLTEYLIHLKLSKARNPRKYASTVIM